MLTIAEGIPTSRHGLFQKKISTSVYCQAGKKKYTESNYLVNK